MCKDGYSKLVAILYVAHLHKALYCSDIACHIAANLPDLTLGLQVLLPT